MQAYVGGLFREQGTDVVEQWLNPLLGPRIDIPYLAERRDHLVPDPAAPATTSRTPALSPPGGLQRSRDKKVLIRIQDCDQRQPGTTQGKLPASQSPLTERNIGLAAGANDEELACKMAEVEMQVSHRHNDPADEPGLKTMS